MEAVKTIQYKKHIINIIQDEDYNITSDDGDNDLFLLYYHRDFYITRKGFSEPKTMEDIKAWRKNYHLFTVYAYIHTGVALSLSNEVYPFDDQWDVSNCGFVMIKKGSGIRNHRKAAQALIEEYNDILSGNVYGYQITFNGNYINSCWGFVGDIDKSGIIDEAKSIVDYEVTKNPIKFAEQLALNL
jgi:hypothetical protein